jgi:hypothetical protein
MSSKMCAKTRTPRCERRVKIMTKFFSMPNSQSDFLYGDYLVGQRTPVAESALPRHALGRERIAAGTRVPVTGQIREQASGSRKENELPAFGMAPVTACEKERSWEVVGLACEPYGF